MHSPCKQHDYRVGQIVGAARAQLAAYARILPALDSDVRPSAEMTALEETLAQDLLRQISNLLPYDTYRVRGQLTVPALSALIIAISEGFVPDITKKG